MWLPLNLTQQSLNDFVSLPVFTHSHALLNCSCVNIAPHFYDEEGLIIFMESQELCQSLRTGSKCLQHAVARQAI